MGQSTGREEISNLPVEDKATIGMNATGLYHTQNESVDNGTVDGTGDARCSSSGKETKEDDDWGGSVKTNGATLHSHMHYLHAMPPTQCCLVTKTLPIYRDRKQLVCMNSEGHNIEGDMPYLAMISRTESKRSGCVCRAHIMGKKLKLLDSTEKLQLDPEIGATPPMQMQVKSNPDSIVLTMVCVDDLEFEARTAGKEIDVLLQARILLV
ncbi:unnamed protein product [Sphagnum tenellum]